MKRRYSWTAAALACGLAATVVADHHVKPEESEVWDPEPVVVTPGQGAAAPSDATVLFGGDSLEAWESVDGGPAEWVIEDGAFVVAPGSGAIQTRQGFGDVQLHIEWRTPPVVEGEGQGRGNSGIFLQGQYEVQVLDSHENRTYSNGQAASIYKQHIPLVNASRAPGDWQSYEIIFEAPRFNEDGGVDRPAFMTVLHNGVLVQNRVELAGPTVYIGEPSYQAHADKLPIALQDHGNPVSFRNIWIRELNLPD